MSNFKSLLYAFLILGAFVVPLLLHLVNHSIQQQGFTKTVTEFNEFVKEEGGVSAGVKQLASNLSNKGYTITFNKDGLLDFGDKVEIQYHYKFNSVTGIQELKTKNTVVIHKRSG